MGLDVLASKIRDEGIAAPEEAFNRAKTWPASINRLLGAILGLLIIGMTFYSITLRKEKPILFYGSLAALILVVFQGWIGSVVVSTNLLPGMVTFHMALAVLLIGLLIYIFHRASVIHSDELRRMFKPKRVNFLLVIAMLLFFTQVAVGTQVREAIDLVAASMGLEARDQWIGQLGGVYYLHRTFSLVLIAISGYLLVLLRKSDDLRIRNWADLLIGLVALEVVLGIVMAYMGVPPWAQPLHLLVSLLIIGLQYWLFLHTRKTSNA